MSLQVDVLAQAGATVTETSLELSAPRELTWDQYAQLGNFLGKLGQAYCWWVGDFLLYGEDLFGEEFAQISSSLPHSHHTLENYRSIAKRIPPNRRRSGLSFGVHETVAYLEPHDREHWLDLAERNDWKRDGIREARRQARELESGENSGPRKCPYCGREMEER